MAKDAQEDVLIVKQRRQYVTQLADIAQQDVKVVGKGKNVK